MNFKTKERKEGRIKGGRKEGREGDKDLSTVGFYPSLCSLITYFFLQFSSSLFFLSQKCTEIYHLPKSSLGCPSLI